jgi:hypothetical protein
VARLAPPLDATLCRRGSSRLTPPVSDTRGAVRERTSPRKGVRHLSQRGANSQLTHGVRHQTPRRFETQEPGLLFNLVLEFLGRRPAVRKGVRHQTPHLPQATLELRRAGCITWGRSAIVGAEPTRRRTEPPCRRRDCPQFCVRAISTEANSSTSSWSALPSRPRPFRTTSSSSVATERRSSSTAVRHRTTPTTRRFGSGQTMWSATFANSRSAE